MSRLSALPHCHCYSALQRGYLSKKRINAKRPMAFLANNDRHRSGRSELRTCAYSILMP